MPENRLELQTSIKNRIFDLIAVAAFTARGPFPRFSSTQTLVFVTARALQDKLGVTVVRNYYYEPVMVDDKSRRASTLSRELRGIDWNLDGQKKMLARFCFAAELLSLEGRIVMGKTFSYENGMYGAGDAEALYSFIRAFKPTQIIEIGSGWSTIVAKLAIEANRAEECSYTCRQICFEPFEAPWLESIGVEVKRQRIECTDLHIFEDLSPNDIVFNFWTSCRACR